MKISEELPTIFAMKLGESCGLLIEQKNGCNYHLAAEMKQRMQWFQQMAVTSTFEDCVQVYFGNSLSDEQLSILKLIHRTTKPWITGHIVGVLMDRIENGKMANRDFAEAVRVLVEQAQENESGAISQRMQGILVKSTRTDRAA